MNLGYLLGKPGVLVLDPMYKEWKLEIILSTIRLN